MILDRDKYWGPGWTYYRCEDCGNQWAEKSRECRSPSRSICENCYKFSHPCGHEMHLEWIIQALEDQKDSIHTVAIEAPCHKKEAKKKVVMNFQILKKT